ncbi:MAG TPA: TonB family protein [Thermoanaerobaculia bacterium]|nr:TonB family protein [Thermoanaerobaculia bacterium]
MTDLQGQIDGKYEILAKIREGGMGAVYKVRHLLLDEIRVAKVIHPHLDDDPEVRARFLREARAASRLRHPNIAQLFDFMVDPAGDQFLVLEYIDGLTLRDLLRRSGPPALALALEIARQSLAALGYLHRRGFVHRDISPDNLMLTRGPDGGPLVKLIDLGIAKSPRASDHGLTQSGIFLGKPRYAAPEALEGHEVDARSDLYSFGVVLYELLTGQRPFEGKTPHELMAAHIRQPPRPFAETDPEGRLPPELREAVLAALVKNPAARVATAEELAHRLAAAAPSVPPWTEADLDALVPRPPTGVHTSPSGPSTWKDGRSPAPAAPPQTVASAATITPPTPAEPMTAQRSGYTTHVATPPPLPPLPAQPRRRGRMVPLLLAVIAIAATLGLWKLTSPRDEPNSRGGTVTAPAEPSTGVPEETTRQYTTEEEPAGESTAPPLADESQPSAEPEATGRQPGFVPAKLAEPLRPVYPREARGAGGIVRATVDAQIDENGELISADVPFLSSTTSPGRAYVFFKEAALRAVREARFEPARRNGVAVADKVRIVVELRPPG